MMKRAYYIGNFIVPDGNAAGKRVYANGKLLQMLGYDVVFIGLPNSQNSGKFCEKVPLLRKETFFSFSYSKNPFSWFFPRNMFCYVKHIIESNCSSNYSDTIFFYGSPCQAGFVRRLLKLAKKKNIPIISDCVDWLTVKTPNFLFNLIRNFDNFYLKAILNKRANGVVTISKYLYDYYSTSLAHVVIIPPLANEVKNDEIKESSFSKLCFVYAGQLFRKNQKKIDPRFLKDRIDIVIDSLVLLKKDNVDFVFNVFGFSKSEFLRAMPQQQNNLFLLDESIDFHGKVDNQYVLNEIKKSHFFLLVRDSKRDTNAGFPSKIVESISYGTPVVTTRTSDIDSYLVEGVHGYFVEPNSHSLYKKLLDISSFTPTQFSYLREQCLQSKLFHYEKFAGKMEKFLKSLE